jgi:putative component of membrane protein insertase Oxa1/YidC/SpoIIIJ protein YidD
LKRPEPYLGLLLLIAVAVAVDQMRDPSEQLSARAYVSLVEGYQAVGRPLIAGHVRCRFTPSCSEYSLAAVKARGFVGGLWISVLRLSRCTTDTPMGTFDPAPGVREATAR